VTDIALQNLAYVAHPNGQRRRIIDANIPRASFQRVEFAVAIAD
jgi:hypothetical protein